MTSLTMTDATQDVAGLAIAGETISRLLDADPCNPTGPPLVAHISEETGHLLRVISECDEDYEAEVALAKREHRERRDGVRKAHLESNFARELIEEAAAIAAAAAQNASLLAEPNSVQLVSGAGVEPERYDWLWDQHLARGKFHLIAGAPGCAKTTAALSFGATVSVGGLWPDGTRAPLGNILMWSGEDDFRDTILPRYMAMGGDRGRLYFIGPVTTAGGKRPFDPATDLDALRRAARKIGDVGLLIVDPIVNAVTGDSHKNSETRRSLQPLVDLAESLNAVLLGITHFTKGTSGRDPVERVTGSLAFGALPRMVFAAAETTNNGEGDEQRRIFVKAKTNIASPGGGFAYISKLTPVPNYDMSASVVAWGEVLKGSARELLKDAESSGESSKKHEAMDLIQQVLTEKGGSVPAADLHLALGLAGIGRDSRHQAIKEALRLNRIKRLRTSENGPWTYTLPMRVAPVSAFEDPNADLISEGGAV